MANTKTITTLVLLATLGAVVVMTTGTTKIPYTYGIQDQGNTQDSLAKIIIVKTGNLGPQDKGDFVAEVKGNHPSPTPVNLGTDQQDRTVTIRPGSYNVHEIGESGGRLERDYDVKYSEGCSGTIKPSTTITCTITNDFTGTYP
jgi:hypothetical protein